jgi:hypothetical protein
MSARRRRSASSRAARQTWRSPTLRRLRGAYLVEDDGQGPQRWLRTYRGDVVLEHQP